MNTSRIPAVMATVLLLLCPSQADTSEECATEESAAERRDDESAQDHEPQDLQRTERQSDDSEISKVVDQDRPAMPIPIPGVGRQESDETIDS